MPTPRIKISTTAENFEIAAAQSLLALITTAIDKRGACLMALSGGNTPRGVYRRLADLLAANAVDLSRLHLIFSDERMVPPSVPNSNYGMIQQEFVSRLHDSSLHLYRIKGEITAEDAALEYDMELQKLFPQFRGRCDVVLLGVGEDGHTASLFPGTDILRERKRIALEVLVPLLARWRVTLTLPVINRSREVLFLATGTMKANIVAKILASKVSREDLPATLVRPDPGRLTWMLDAEAASQIPSEGYRR